MRAVLNKCDIVEHDNCEDAIETVQISAIDLLNHCASILDETCNKSITMENLRTACKKESTYTKLVANIENGFPQSRMKTDPNLRDYWEVPHRLSSVDGIAMLNSRIIIPDSYRATTLKMLHSAHQGVGSMTRRANQTVYWPGITTSIRSTRYNCERCNSSSPSQAKEPLLTSKSPEYPFQYVCADYFEIKGHHYLVIVDRFSSWITIYYFPPMKLDSKTLIGTFRELFINYGIPEEISSDGGPQFTSVEFQNFILNWRIKHRRSSANYPQSNGRAEVGVKSAKRIIYDNEIKVRNV